MTTESECNARIRNIAVAELCGILRAVHWSNQCNAACQGRWCCTAPSPDRPRRLTGKPQRLNGFWINLTDALPLCRQFNLDDGLTNLVQGLVAKCAAGLDCAKPASNCGQAAAADAEELREPL
jgi:hypothetical protein